MDSGSSIFALASGASRAALHFHRASGPRVFELLSPCLRQMSSRPLGLGEWVPEGTRPRTRHVKLVADDGSVIDDAVITAYRAPWSYTGENLVEISTHGNPLITTRLHSRLRELGLRDARPGEFTERAFRHGKLDLSQAEAVHDLISSSNEGALRLARDAAEGKISEHVTGLRDALLGLLAHLEAAIDFDESEVGTLPTQELREGCRALASRLQALAETWSSGSLVRNGVAVSLVGCPNAGKSTLFNGLLQKDRAIVTPIPGTTRDVLEDHLMLRGREFVLRDTAGIRETSDTVEAIGVERARAAARASDIVCLVTEASRPLAAQEAFASRTGPEQAFVVVFSKQDLVTAETLKRRFDEARSLGLGAVTTSPTSLDGFLDFLCQTHDALIKRSNPDSLPTLISARQRDAARGAARCLLEAEQELAQGLWPEKVASTLNAAQERLGEIVGVITPDDVLGRIFGEFCIGK